MSPPLSEFVAARQARWADLTEILDRVDRRHPAPGIDAIDLAYELSREIAADLARAQLRYAGTDVERHLAHLVSRASRVLEMPPPRHPWRRAWFFLSSQWPQLVRRRQRPLALAAMVLLGGTFLGALATWVDPALGATMVGPEIAGAVERGELWTDPIEAEGRHIATSAFIFTNNIKVAITAFAFGLVFGIGALLLLLYNGMHLGSVLAYTGTRPEVQRGLLDFIAAHGPVELTLITIAGGAGLWLGSALIDPGEHPRGEALRRRGREAVQLVVGTAPCFVLIGLVEGFVSPGHLLPTWLKAILGGTLLCLLLLFTLGGRRATRSASGDQRHRR